MPLLLALVLMGSFCWRYIFRNPSLANCNIRPKLLHALAVTFLGCNCWLGLLSASWMIEHPVKWVQWVLGHKNFYPVWVDFAFQSIGAITNIAGCICCYFLLRLSEAARRWLMPLIPLMYLVFCYNGIAALVREGPKSALFVFVWMFCVSAVPFFGIFVFYRMPSIKAWFILKPCREEAA